MWVALLHQVSHHPTSNIFVVNWHTLSQQNALHNDFKSYWNRSLELTKLASLIVYFWIDVYKSSLIRSVCAVLFSYFPNSNLKKSLIIELKCHVMSNLEGNLLFRWAYSYLYFPYYLIKGVIHHWAVQVENIWYEIDFDLQGGKKGKYNQIAKTFGNIAKSGAGT